MVYAHLLQAKSLSELIETAQDDVCLIDGAPEFLALLCDLNVTIIAITNGAIQLSQELISHLRLPVHAVIGNRLRETGELDIPGGSKDGSGIEKGLIIRMLGKTHTASPVFPETEHQTYRLRPSPAVWVDWFWPASQAAYTDGAENGSARKAGELFKPSGAAIWTSAGIFATSIQVDDFRSDSERRQEMSRTRLEPRRPRSRRAAAGAMLRAARESSGRAAGGRDSG